MKTYRIHENGQWYHTDHAPDRASGCLVALMWSVVVIVLALTVLAMNYGAAGAVNWIISAL